MSGDLEIISRIDEISKQLGNVTDMHGLTSSIEKIIDSITEVPYTGLYLFDPASKSLKMYCAKGFTEEERLEAERTAMERHPGEVFMSQKTLIIDDVDDDKLKQSVSSKRSFKVRSRIWLPVKSINESVGAFGLASSEKNAFSDLHVALLSFTCNLAGVVYKNIIYKGEKRVFEKQISSFRSEKTQLEKDIERVKSNQKDLKKTLTERELLIREIHHRVKNNMQIISSLINLRLNEQQDEVSDKYNHHMTDLKSKIQSMSMLHEVLYEGGDYTKINLIDYIKRITTLFCRTYDVSHNNVAYNFNENELYIDLEKGISCGLILQELITNAIKHGFKGKLKKDDEISIGLEQEKKNQVTLRINDNGIGFENSFDLKNLNGFGMGIVESLVDQIDGVLTLDKSKKEYALRFTL